MRRFVRQINGNDYVPKPMTITGIPYSDGVAIECLWSVDGVHYFIDRSVHYNATPTLWSGIGVALECIANMQINTPKTLRSGIGVFCESGIGVVVME